MNNKSLKSIKRNLKDQAQARLQDKSVITFVKSSLLGTFLVILSGVILYADKIIVFLDLNFIMPSRYEEYDFETFIWSISVTLSPLLLILVATTNIKTFKEAYVVPLYAYTLQLWFLLFDLKVVDKDYLGWYTLGTCAIIIPIVIYFKRKEENSIKDRVRETKEKLLD